MHGGSQSFRNARRLVLVVVLQPNFFTETTLRLFSRRKTCSTTFGLSERCGREGHGVWRGATSLFRDSESRIEKHTRGLFFYRILDDWLWISIAVQYYGAQLQYRGATHPYLPVGKQAVCDRELVCNLDIGRQPPEGQNARHY